MVRKLRVPAVAMLAALTFAASAGAAPGDCRLIRGATTPTDPTDDVQVCEQQTYFHRTGTGLANLNPIPSWNTTAPTASDAVPYAAILGRLVNTSNQVRPTFSGGFTGNIDTLRVDNYVTIPVYQAALGSYPLIFELQIDGQVVINESPAAGGEKDVPLTATDEPHVYKMSFAIKNLHQAMENLGLDTGDGVQHTVRISMAALYYGDSNGTYWFDSAARPGGIYFNPNKPTGTVYDALQYA